MKLLNKTGKYYLLGVVGVMLVGGIVFYFLLSHFLDFNETQNLRKAKDLVVEQLNKLGNKKPNLLELDGGLEILSENYQGKNVDFLKDTTLLDVQENEIIPARTLTFSVKTAQNNYLIRLTKSLIERDEVTEMIVRLMAILLFLFVVALFLLNRLIARTVWSPFYEILTEIKDFKVSQNTPLTFTKTDISEFNNLQNVLLQMTNKISTDYHALKEFTENASHEIQTPLAIIQSKLEILIQSENLQESQMKTIQTVYEAASRLSKLNQSLLLLTKIDNQQFVEKEKINLANALEKTLWHYEDFIEGKAILLRKNVDSSVEMTINPTLLDILLSNLLGNAIKHNFKNGNISVTLTHQKLVIKNTGKPLENQPSAFFGRFKKGNANSDSLGLGLAIVKKICEVNNIKIAYYYQEKIHSLELIF